tara:strand:- start:282 stop:536 length:255 start_codon:yes stop_codon:yes gene_type:complete
METVHIVSNKGKRGGNKMMYYARVCPHCGHLINIEISKAEPTLKRLEAVGKLMDADRERRDIEDFQTHLQKTKKKKKKRRKKTK